MFKQVSPSIAGQRGFLHEVGRIIGKSNTEFLVMYSYTSFEDVTSATYVSLFQNDKGKARRISTLKLFDAKT